MIPLYTLLMTIYILILALFLRLILINQSLWLDESIQALALMGQKGPLLQYALGDYQPPLYHLIGYAWTRVAGFSEFALRTPSLLSGILTVFFVIKIAQYLYNKKVGYIAGLLAATNPLLIYYSQEGRTYAMTTFFVTASFYYYLKLIHVKNIRYSILYALFSILFLWTSYLTWFLFFGLFIYNLYQKKYHLVWLQIIAGSTLLFWAPSLLSSLNIGNSTRFNSPEWGRVVGGFSWKSLPLTWVKFALGRISFDNKLLYAAIVVVIGILHTLALRLTFKNKSSFSNSAMLVLWLATPIIFGITTATILPIYQYFRVLFVLPAYLLLLSIGLSRFSSKLPFILMLSTHLFALGYFWLTPRLHKEDWRTVVESIPSNATVAMPTRAQSDPLIYYGYTQNVFEPSHEKLIGDKIFYIRYVEDLFDAQRKGQKNLLDSGYTITSQQYYPGIQVDIYENSN